MPSALISTTELAKRLLEPQLHIIDLRGSVRPPTEPPPHYVSHRADYEEEHIPGALFLSWHDELNEAATTTLVAAVRIRDADGPVRRIECQRSHRL